MCFVQFRVSDLIIGAYVLWKFENSAQFLTSEKAAGAFFKGLAEKAGQKLLLLVRFSPSVPRLLRTPIYI